MQFMDQAELKKSGRNFNCESCKPKIQKLRRCEEDRFDFDTKDGSIWPMRLHEGGGMYGFCPAKARWDNEALSIYNLLIVCCETKQLLYAGGIAEQPGWFVDLLSWFVTRYDENKFYSRARSILGSNNKVSSSGNRQGRTNPRSSGGFAGPGQGVQRRHG